MKKALKLIALFAYVATIIISGAGAINYGATTSQSIYWIFGLLGIAVGAWSVYQAVKKNNIL